MSCLSSRSSHRTIDPHKASPSASVCRTLFGGLAAMLVAAPLVARGEFPEPRLTALFPPGGQRGTEVEVTLIGSDLDEADRLEFFHPGITSAPIVPAATEFDPEPWPVAGKVRVSHCHGRKRTVSPPSSSSRL